MERLVIPYHGRYHLHTCDFNSPERGEVESLARKDVNLDDVRISLIFLIEAIIGSPICETFLVLYCPD